MTTDTIKQLGAEFHYAADGVGEALQRLERARVDRLAFLRRCSKDSTARLATLKEEIRTLPEQIAKWEAERAHLEAQTGLDLLRAVVTERVKCDGNHAGPPCADRECWNRCERCRHTAHDGECRAEVEAMADEAEKPTLLDLTKLPPGTVCEATADIPIIDTPFEIPTGERFTICTVLQNGVLPVEVHIGGQGDDWWLPDCVPARVVEEPKGESDG